MPCVVRSRTGHEKWVPLGYWLIQIILHAYAMAGLASNNFILEEWTVHRIFGNTLAKQGQVQPDTVASYFSAIKSYHIDRHLSLEAFHALRLVWIRKGGKRLFPKKKATCLPITFGNMSAKLYFYTAGYGAYDGQTKDILRITKQAWPWTGSTSIRRLRWHGQVFYHKEKLLIPASSWKNLCFRRPESQDWIDPLRQAISMGFGGCLSS